ncbi:RraA family protein [Nocardia sp. R16R-3T]
MPDPIPDALLKEAARFPSATLHEAAGRAGALPGYIGPVRPGMSVAGRAYPVSGPGGDNLWLHRAIYECAPGDVIVASVGPERDFGYWGEVMAVAAIARGIAGLVIDGCVRDAVQLEQRGFPVFSSGLCIRGTVKNPIGYGTLGTPITVGEVTVRRGDLVVGDADGVVVLAGDSVADVVGASARREEKETHVFARLGAGERSLDIYDMPRLTR